MATGRPSIFVARRVVIVNTLVVPQPDRVTVSHYEIHTAPDLDFPHPTIFVTRSKSDYEAALFAEGTAARFDIRWSHGTRKGRRCQVLEELDPAAPRQEIAR